MEIIVVIVLLLAVCFCGMYWVLNLVLANMLNNFLGNVFDFFVGSIRELFMVRGKKSPVAKYAHAAPKLNCGKIIAVDNMDREHISDELFCDNIHERSAERILEFLNSCSTNPYFYRFVKSDYKLYKYDPNS